VDADGLVGERNSLVLEALGRVHIAYLDWTDGVLKWARSP
jgi:hypothetical protein